MYTWKTSWQNSSMRSKDALFQSLSLSEAAERTGSECSSSISILSTYVLVFSLSCLSSTGAARGCVGVSGPACMS
ncbi:hypothetical protein BD311DRAFT_753561 [Dichomitus squalens]|uniref:Uncharacterized protein n=1 Tax=Dichomitus squalens TaxID=114155 RepID=A0A4Q9MT33_9APHY|nr:hypothetical protein BD311DRAFT_753561 [Dichomitus squalens]